MYTAQELSDFLRADPKNVISFFVSRNPTQAYKYIKQNFEGYPNLSPGSEKTVPSQNSMERFIDKQYDASPNQGHFIQQLMLSIPKDAQMQNWTTAIN